MAQLPPAGTGVSSASISTPTSLPTPTPTPTPTVADQSISTLEATQPGPSVILPEIKKA
jgi:hypothetical protein